MIRDLLIPALETKFPDRGLRTGTPPDAIAVFLAAHSEVGDVMIYDDGHQATVGIGTITHGHFSPYDATLTNDEIAARVTEVVITFLTDLFANRVLLWKLPEGGSGGWRILAHDHQYSLMKSDDLTFLWSGPVDNPDAG